jgi:hypothetical protein
MTYEGSSRNTLKPDAFQFGGLWTVGNTKQGDKFEDLLVDTWNDRPQPIADLNGNEMGTKSDDESLRKGYLAGAIVKFKAQAREKTGQVVVGNGQVRMVVARALDGESVDESDTKAFHPIAVVTNVDDPTRVAYARFRFDGDDIYVASLGGVAEAWMGFEFPVPAGYRPIALYIKNVRVDLEGKPATEYASPLERDEMVGSGQISGMAAVGPILDDKGNPVQAQAQNGPVIDPIVLGNSIGFMIQKGTERSLEVAQEGRGWTVRSGELKLRNDEVKGVSAGIDPKLQVNRFSVADDTVVVKVDISPAVHTADYNKLLDGAPKDQSPVLVDTEDRTYPAVGFVYKDSGITWVRFTKGNPISGLGASGMPQLSRSTPDRKLTLVFAVPLGVSIKQFKIGDVVLEDRTAKPIKADQRQR